MESAARCIKDIDQSYHNNITIISCCNNEMSVGVILLVSCSSIALLWQHSAKKVTSHAQYIAQCKCKQVQFLLTGTPNFTPNCHCTDCVTAADYLDCKARRNKFINISHVVNDNPQAAALANFPPFPCISSTCQGKRIIKIL